MAQQTTGHYATTETVQGDFHVYFHDDLVARADRAVALREYHDGREHPTVWYFAPALVAGLETTQSTKTTFCPIKGTASYLDYGHAEAAIWCYRDPMSGVEAIRGLCAFDPGSGFRVEKVSAG